MNGDLVLDGTRLSGVSATMSAAASEVWSDGSMPAPGIAILGSSLVAHAMYEAAAQQRTRAIATAEVIRRIGASPSEAVDELSSADAALARGL